MVTYNDTRFIYNNEGLTYNGAIFFNVSDNSLTSEISIRNVYGLNSDTVINSESIFITRVMVVSVSDNQSTTDNIVFNISTYNIEIQSLTDASLNTVELIQQDTVSSNDSKLIDILSNNVDIIYITDSGGVSSLLFKKTKPGVVGLDRITPLILKAIKHKPLVQ